VTSVAFTTAETWVTALFLVLCSDIGAVGNG
jgi:hypothetical protein